MDEIVRQCKDRVNVALGVYQQDNTVENRLLSYFQIEQQLIDSIKNYLGHTHEISALIDWVKEVRRGLLLQKGGQ
jgi:hypothetical protein